MSILEYVSVMDVCTALYPNQPTLSLRTLELDRRGYGSSAYIGLTKLAQDVVFDASIGTDPGRLRRFSGHLQISQQVVSVSCSNLATSIIKDMAGEPYFYVL